ncbi:hypothetical protein Tco_0261650 [Tanacetum coccineum]
MFDQLENKEIVVVDKEDDNDDDIDDEEDKVIIQEFKPSWKGQDVTTMNNSGRDHIVYSLVQGDGELRHMRHEKMVLVGGGSSSQQHTHQPMSPISSFSTINESTDEHEIGDEYLTNGYLTEKEQQQLLLDEEALRETLEEEARAEKKLEERIKQEQSHDELFRLEFGVKSDSEYESD